MFYNVENLFDIFDDSTKNDNEFLPTGKKYWGVNKYNAKLENISKVIAAVGEWQMPVVIGMCEIENRKVLNDLFTQTMLSKYQYRFVHYDSPDPRGIDVAMAYLPDKFKVLHSHPIRVHYTKQNGQSTRDILYCKGILLKKDTLHILINHWPSRRGGKDAEIKRNFVARLVRKCTDSIFQTDPDAKIIIMGDLNDEPSDRSLVESLGARQLLGQIVPGNLYNLASTFYSENKYGSIKYQGHWTIFDQIIVSGKLITGGETGLADYHICNSPFIVKQDKSHTGFTPLRTYNGMKYEGGYSDHLPVYLDYYLH